MNRLVSNFIKLLFSFFFQFVSKIIDIFLSQQLWLSEVNDIFTLNVNLLQKERKNMPTIVCAFGEYVYQGDAYINKMSKNARR